MMLLESVTVLDGVDGNHLVPPAVDVLQPEQQTVAHLMEVLLTRCGSGMEKFNCMHNNKT